MKTFTLEATKNPYLFRVIDREGDWEHYLHKPSGKYLRGVTSILGRAYPKGAGFQKYLLGITAEAAEKLLKAAGDRGSAVHRAIESALTFEAEGKAVVWNRETGFYNSKTKDYEKLDNKGWDAFLSFARFWNLHEPILLACEQPLYSLTEGYSGTTDAIVILTKACTVKSCGCLPLIGKIGVWDWKTSSGIWESYSAQVGALAKGQNIKSFLPPGVLAADYIAIGRFGTSHRTTGGYEIEAWSGDEMEECYQRFLATKRIDDFTYRPFDPEAEIKDIPDSVEVAVKTFDFTKANADYQAAQSSGEKKPKTNGKGKRSGKSAQRPAEVASR